MADLGSDFAGVEDLDPNLTIVSGRRCLIENLARRLMTDKGGLLDDPTYGEPVVDLVGDVVDAGKLAQKIEDQFYDDERVESAEVDVTYNAKTRELLIACTVDDGDGSFDFVIKGTELTVEILSAEV